MGIAARQSIKGTIANYIGVGIGFITTFFVQTKLLTAEEIGLVEVLVQSAFLFSGLAQLGTNSSAIRYYPYFKDAQHKDHGFFGWTLIVPFIGFLIFLTAFLVFKPLIAGAFIEKSALFVDYIDFVVPLAFFMLYISVFETNSNLLLRIAVPKFIREAGLRVMILAIYLLYGFGMISIKGLVIYFCLAYGAATLVNLIYLLSLRKISFKIEKGCITPEMKRDFLIYTAFMITSALAGNITPLLNKFFLAGKEGLFTAGVFTIAVNIAMVVEMPYRSLGAISKPMISEALALSDIRRADKICKDVSLHQLIAGSIVLFIIWINLDLFFSFLPNGEIYEAGKWVVLIIGLSRLFNSVLGIGVTALGYSPYYYFSLIFTVLLTGLSIFLNVILIPLWGMEGAAGATALSYALYYMLLLWTVYRKIGVSPFSKEEMKVLLVVLGMFFADFLWSRYCSGLFCLSIDKYWWGAVAAAVLRTGLISFAGLALLFRMRVSPQMNEILIKIFTFNKKKQ